MKLYYIGMNTVSSKVNSSDKSNQLKAKLRAKFGDKYKKADSINEKRAKEKAKDAEKVDISKAAKSKKSKDVIIGDVKDNSPDSDMTQAKLKGLLQTGGFHFNDKEREALSSILDV